MAEVLVDQSEEFPSGGQGFTDGKAAVVVDVSRVVFGELGSAEGRVRSVTTNGTG